jgi:hypothetical protein
MRGALYLAFLAIGTAVLAALHVTLFQFAVVAILLLILQNVRESRNY